MEKLIEKIKKSNSAYRKGKPKITDEEYDGMLTKLQSMMKSSEFETFKAQLMEAPGNIKHKYIIGSLNKLKYEDEDLFKWLEKQDFYSIVVSDKIDGCSFVARYENGNLVSGATRGDGETGVDITNKLRHILPNSIPSTNSIYLRGELTLTDNSHVELGFKNRRNGTVGLINSDTINPEKLAKIKYYVHQILNFDDMIMENQFHWLDHNKLDRVCYQVFRVDQTIGDHLKVYLEQRKIKSPYDMDGLVITGPNCLNEHTYYPDKKVAFKVNSEGISAEVIGIEWKTSRGGLVKPVVIITPTEIDGTTVSRAAAFNAKHVQEQGLGNGAIVKIIRSGEVIPKIISVIKPALPHLPSTCPACGTPLVWDGVELKCKYDGCAAVSIKKLEYFLKTCEVDGISEKTLDNFGIFTFEDLIEFVPDSKYKQQTSLYNQLQTKIFSLEAIDLHSKLPFSGAGEATIDKMVEFYGFDEINAMLFAKKMPLTFPEGIGQVTLAKLRDSWVENVRIMQMFIDDPRFKPVIKVKQEAKTEANTKLGGKSFLLTGTLSKPRKEIESMIIEAGGIISVSVSKKLDYLLVGSSPGSKLNKAKTLEINIISESDLNAMIKG